MDNLLESRNRGRVGENIKELGKKGESGKGRDNTLMLIDKSLFFYRRNTLWVRKKTKHKGGAPLPQLKKVEPGFVRRPI